MANTANDSTADWRPVLASTLSSRIIEQVREAVLDGKLRPGQFLGTEASLAQQFGVSRMAARDAIRSLHGLGLITIRKGAGGGITIARGDPDRLAEAMAIQLTLLGVAVPDLLEAQFAIELVSAELAAQHATATDLKRLDAALENAEINIDHAWQFIDSIFEFHLELVKASHNPALGIPLKAYLEVLGPYYRAGTTKERAQRVTRRYRKLVEAISNRDPAAAKTSIGVHFGEVRRSLFLGAERRSRR